MARFEEAFKKTMGHEGGYSNDPNDRGGETYRGIARKFHHDWHGWKVIDKIKESDCNKAKYNLNESLQRHVRIFYREHYWNKFGGEAITSQAVANELFDTGVNMGVGRAKRFLQEAINLLNRNGNLTPDIAVDGLVGSKTIAGLSALFGAGDEKNVLKVLNLLQSEKYLVICRRDPIQEKFLRGWMNRVSV